MPKKRVFSLLLLLMVALAACAPSTVEPGAALEPTPETAHNAPDSGAADELPPAVQAAIAELAKQNGLSAEAIAVIDWSVQEWSDSCLGLGGPAESCAAVVTPGLRVMLDHAGTTYEVRTDLEGTAVRIADPELMQPGTDAPLPDIGGAVAFYQRSGGIAGELVTVRVFADGRIERTVEMGAPNNAVEVITVDPATVAALLADLEAAGYGKLERSYLPQDACCDRYFYLTAAEIDGELVAVETVDATEEAPAELWRSIELFEQFIEQSAE